MYKLLSRSLCIVDVWLIYYFLALGYLISLLREHVQILNIRFKFSLNRILLMY